LRSLQWICQEILLNFTKPKIYHGLLHQPATDPCPDPGEPSPNPHILRPTDTARCNWTCRLWHTV